MSTPSPLDEKFSGHESFVCRYGWLRKAYDAVEEDPKIFTHLERAIISLGIGSNMVKALEFWARSFDVIAPIESRKARAYEVTPFARAILDPKTGADPFLEDLGSLWILHWRLVTQADLAAWNLIFQELQETRITQSRLIELLQRRGRRSGAPLVANTVRQHLDILLNTYTSSTATNLRALEESLGSPLQELGLLARHDIEGSSPVDSMIEIRIGPKPSLSTEIFLAATIDYWVRTNPSASSVSLAEVMFGKRSPGVVFKLDEAAVIEYLNEIPKICDRLTYHDGALVRALQLKPKAKLEAVRQRVRFA